MIKLIFIFTILSLASACRFNPPKQPTFEPDTITKTTRPKVRDQIVVDWKEIEPVTYDSTTRELKEFPPRNYDQTLINDLQD